MMTTKLPTYDKYKPSGVEWLGEIPEHWEIQKGKWLFIKQERPIRKEDEIVTCFRDGEVTLRTNRKTEGFTIALREHGYQGIRKGDLVIHNMDAFAGAIGVSDSDGKSTPVYSACTPRELNKANPYYYAYFLRDLAKNGFIESLAKGIRERSTDFRFNDFGLLQLSVPPFEEQTAIAQFLDRKTALIDQAIDIKQKQIELLKERRQILIHQAVTRGLNPEVKMKDSGVEWIGEVPEHWEVTKAKFYSTIFVPERAKPELNTEKDGVPWVTTEHLRKNELFESDVTYYVNDSSRKATGSRIIKSNSVVATCVGNFGIASKLNFDCIINQQVQGFTDLKINADYLTQVIGISEDYFKNNSTLTTIMYVSKDTFGSMPIPLPSDKEQKEIVNHIKNLSSKIDTAITLKQQEIAKLQEYKATLINSAVTGKIKVGSHAQ